MGNVYLSQISIGQTLGNLQSRNKFTLYILIANWYMYQPWWMVEDVLTMVELACWNSKPFSKCWQGMIQGTVLDTSSLRLEDGTQPSGKLIVFKQNGGQCGVTLTLWKKVKDVLPQDCDVFYVGKMWTMESMCVQLYSLCKLKVHNKN